MRFEPNLSAAMATFTQQEESFTNDSSFYTYNKLTDRISTLLFEKMIMGLPSASDMTTPTEDIIFEDNFANEIYMKYVDESPGIDLFAEMEQDDKIYLDELQSITNKIDLPINDFVASIENPEEFENIEGSKSEQLLLDFNSIFDGVENELTPPQSPPQLFTSSLQEQQQFSPNNIPATVNNQYEFFNTYQPVQQALTQGEQFIYIQNASPAASTPSQGNVEVSIVYENNNQSIIPSDEIIFDPDSIISSPTDIQRELEVVDELVRAHSRQTSDYEESASSSWSPRSEYSSSGYSQYDDEPVKKSKSGLKGVTKKRTRGYGRNPEEKKSRKKEQNKNAATRYRMKKKQKVEVIMDEEKILMDKNKRLTTAYKDTKREVKYLKSLLRDLFKARGFI
ncbi:hypothetical protein PVAND_014008 [Polypedilum vanderplanki]|uniref:BZIP domain-containing protein n=1 Tax=Polypedilum vanderplanki TaxID=319348 RepID=A0A9J6CT73_POLVA|nr:hypothetical protein PVAND_014008 [Polypedilum vanderplanki]